MELDKLSVPASPQVNQSGYSKPAIYRLASIGNETMKVVKDIFEAPPGADSTFSPLSKWEDPDIIGLAEALSLPWTDEKAAILLKDLLGLSGVVAELDGQSVARWVRAHPNKPEMVVDCATVIPPDEIIILAALSKTGSQKRVYFALWKKPQREVVLKSLIGTLAQQAVVLERELQSHPFAMKHPNIIATLPLTNSKGEKFLVEEKIEALNDQWKASGIHQAANLLYDIAQALAYLHGEERLVHGDIKPDNIGQKGGAYTPFPHISV